MLASEAREVIMLLDDLSKVSNTLVLHKKIVYATQYYAEFCNIRDRNLEKTISNIKKRHAKYIEFSR